MKNKYELLEKRVVSTQRKLKKLNPKSELVSLVEVDKMTLKWSGEFGARYSGMTVFDGLTKYCEDMDKIIYPLLNPSHQQS